MNLFEKVLVVAAFVFAVFLVRAIVLQLNAVAAKLAGALG